MKSWFPYASKGNQPNSLGSLFGTWADYDVILPTISYDKSKELIGNRIKGLITSVSHNPKKIYLNPINYTLEEDEDIPAVLKGPSNTYITHDRFDELTKYGCSSCSISLRHKDHRHIFWTSENQPLCLECSETLKA